MTMRFASHVLANVVMHDAEPELRGLSEIFPRALVTADQVAPRGLRADGDDRSSICLRFGCAESWRRSESKFAGWAAEWFDALQDATKREMITISALVLLRHPSVPEIALLSTAVGPALMRGHSFASACALTIAAGERP